MVSRLFRMAGTTKLGTSLRIENGQVIDSTYGENGQNRYKWGIEVHGGYTEWAVSSTGWIYTGAVPRWRPCEFTDWIVHCPGGFALGCLLGIGQTDHVLNKGDRAADFSITTDNGKHITPADFGGSLLVWNFWEMASTPCVKELPSLSDFARKFRPQGVVVLAISGDEDAVKYRDFLTDHHILVETHRDPS